MYTSGVDVVHNVHERHLSTPVETVGSLIDTLASASDQLWPHRWPPLRLDRPLAIGATGGHGPIRYHVETYIPGQRVRFRFEAPAGFDGHHEYVAVRTSERTAVLRHTLVMQPSGSARLTWPLLFRPLHDALMEDSLCTGAAALGVDVPDPPRWSRRVRLLRAVARRRHAAHA